MQDHHDQCTIKFVGRNLMLCGSMTWLGVGLSCKKDGNLDSALVEFWRRIYCLQPSITNLTLNTSVFNRITTRNILQNWHRNACENSRSTHVVVSPFSGYKSNRASLVCLSIVFGSSKEIFQSLGKSSR